MHGTRESRSAELVSRVKHSRAGELASSERVEARLQVAVQTVACCRRNCCARCYRLRGCRSARWRVQQLRAKRATDFIKHLQRKGTQL